jgi:hypothetical protein
MEATTVEVALEQNGDITAEAAHVVVLETLLAKVDKRIHIGRRMRISLQGADHGRYSDGRDADLVGRAVL